MINLFSTPHPAELNASLMGRICVYFSGHESSMAMRLLLILLLAVVAQVMVRAIRALGGWTVLRGQASRNRLGLMTEKPRFNTVAQLLFSAGSFAIYFFALGLVLQEFGVNLGAYLASASIVGLAISFGSQGLIQDIVIGLTLIFWDAMDVGDMVEIFASAPIIGRVEEIGMRFTKITNVYNQKVFVPNRTIATVSRFPHGGVDAYADVQLPPKADPQQVRLIAERVARGMWIQFGAIILSEPTIAGAETVSAGGWSFFRVHFRIWPGQGGLIEATFRQQTVRAMRALDPDYAEWQVPVTYRAAAAPKPVAPHPASGAVAPPASGGQPSLH